MLNAMRQISGRLLVASIARASTAGAIAIALLITTGVSSVGAFQLVDGQNSIAAQASAQPSPAASAPRIETEMVTLTDFTAFPSQLTRHAGKFFLYLVNKTRNPAITLVVDSTVASAAQIQSLTEALDLASFSKNKHIAGIIDSPPGVYHIKSSVTGKVLLTITIQ